MAWQEFKTNDFILGNITTSNNIQFACNIGNQAYWKNIHGDAVLLLVYKGNSYTAFYNVDYFPNGF